VRRTPESFARQANLCKATPLQQSGAKREPISYPGVGRRQAVASAGDAGETCSRYRLLIRVWRPDLKFGYKNRRSVISTASRANPDADVIKNRRGGEAVAEIIIE
jgi:hypothetical protein